MELSGINRRLAYWRARRGLTQEDFAALMGRSRSWVQKLESGDRQLDPRLSVLDKACQVLQIPLEVLLSDTAAQQAAECVDAAEVAAIRAALHRYDVITGVYDPGDTAAALTAAALARQAGYGWDAFQAAHYSAVGRLLPDLIVAAGRAVAAAGNEGQQATLAQASLIYQLACAVLMKFSDAVIAWHAADRAIVAAERCGDPVIVAGATRLLVHALLASGQPRAATDLATTAAARLHGPLRRAGADGLSVYGMLFLKAAVATAEAGDGPATAGLLDEAAGAARLLGSDANRMWTGFGPVNCQVHRVSTHVQLGNGPAAVETASRIDPAALSSLPRERRAAHLVDVARGHALAGQRDQAAQTLLAAEWLAAQEVHCRPHARGLITTLMRQSVPAPSARLCGLAQRAGAAS